MRSTSVKKSTHAKRAPQTMTVVPSSGRAALSSVADADSLHERGLFDDVEAWKDLEEGVITPLVRGKQSGEPIRVWVADTITGEDAYAVAMLLIERVEAEGKKCPLRIFATSDNAEASAEARRGVYRPSLMNGIGRERRERFFRHQGDGYEVDRRVRSAVFFGVHDLLRDPPYSNVDLVLCRRSGARLRGAERHDLLCVFERALHVGGYLVLGTGAVIDYAVEQFVPMSKRSGIYLRAVSRDPVPSASATLSFDRRRRLTWFTLAGENFMKLDPADVGQSLQDLGARMGDDTLADDTAAVLARNAPAARELRGSFGRWVLRQVAPQSDGVLVSVSDIDARKSAEQTIRALAAEVEGRVEERARNLKLLREAVAIANRAESFSQAVQGVLERVCAELGWPIAHAWLREGEAPFLVDTRIWSVASTEMFDRFMAANRPLRHEAGPDPVGRTIRSGVPSWVSLSSIDPPMLPLMTALAAIGLRGALFVPIHSRETVAGVLEFFAPHGAHPGELLVDCLAEIGNQLGGVLEREHSEGAVRRLSSELLLAEERERRQLASDLHDDLGQLLALARMRVDALRAESTAPSADTLRQISDLLGRASDTVRSVTFRLSPPVLRELGVVAAVEWLAENLAPQVPGMELRVDPDAPDMSELSESARFILFRCTRELVMNAVRHARASVVRISFRRRAGWFKITVADDGVGFVQGPPPTQSSYGLSNVRERLSSLGGALAIRSAPGRGTTTTISFPAVSEAR